MGCDSHTHTASLAVNEQMSPRLCVSRPRLRWLTLSLCCGGNQTSCLIRPRPLSFLSAPNVKTPEAAEPIRALWAESRVTKVKIETEKGTFRSSRCKDVCPLVSELASIKFCCCLTQDSSPPIFSSLLLVSSRLLLSPSVFCSSSPGLLPSSPISFRLLLVFSHLLLVSSRLLLSPPVFSHLLPSFARLLLVSSRLGLWPPPWSSRSCCC